MRLRLISKFIFFLPGTFLHELTHFIAALVLGKAEGFSVWPRVEGDSFVFGSVKSRTRLKVLSSFIAVAPVLWWAILYIILRRSHFIAGAGPTVTYVKAIVEKLKSFTYADAFSLWLLVQIIWAGRLSLQDMRNFFSGLLSVSGFALLAIVAAFIYIAKIAG